MAAFDLLRVLNGPLCSVHNQYIEFKVKVILPNKGKTLSLGLHVKQIIHGVT